MNTTELRSPFVERVISLIPRGHEEAMKQAFYNVAAICLFITMAGAAMAVYFILEPFVKPLLWAILVGSVLHPIKQKSTLIACNWLSRLKEENNLLVFGCLSVPLQVVNKSAEWMGNGLVSHLKLIVSLTVGFHFVYIVKQHCSFSDIVYVYELIASMYQRVAASMDILLQPYVAATCLVGFIGLFITIIMQHRIDLSIKLGWVVVFFAISLSLGSWSIVLLGPLLLLISVALAIQWGWLVDDHDSSNITSETVERDEVVLNVSTPKFQTGIARLMKSHIIASALSSLHTPTSVDNNKDLLEVSNSNRYILKALWACLAVQFWRHMWLFHFIPIPLIYFLVKAWGSYFKVWRFLDIQASKIVKRISSHFFCYKDQLFPKPLQCVHQVIYGFDCIS